MTAGGAPIAFRVDRTTAARGRCSHSTSTLQPLPPAPSKLESATPNGSRPPSPATASSGGRSVGSSTRIAHRPCADFGTCCTKDPSARPVGGHDSARHHVLGSGLVKIDVELFGVD